MLMQTAVSQHRFHALVLSQAFDQHLNMVLGDVEETITFVELEPETQEQVIKVRAAPTP